MMKKAHGGSALLMTLLVTSLVSTMLLASWWQASLLFDTVIERERCYKQVLATEVVLQQVVEWAKSHFDQILKNKNNGESISMRRQELTYSCNQVLAKITKAINVDEEWKTQFSSKPHDSKKATKKLFLQVHLLGDDAVLQTIRCLLVRNKKRKLPNGTAAKPSYSMHCFTLGTSF